jgi:putative copper resistance protein D
VIPTDPIARWFALIRAVHFSATLLLFSVFIFDRLIVAPASRKQAFIDQRWRSIAQFLVLLALPLALISGAAWFLFIASDWNDVSIRGALAATVLQSVWESTFGLVWKMRLVFWFLTISFALPAVFTTKRTILRSLATLLALSSSLAFVVKLAAAGHGGSGTKVHQLTDIAHLVIGAAWPVGLLPLGLLLIKLRREANPDRWTAIYTVTRRFSVMSIISVLLLITTGVANSWPLIGKWANLTGTPYGRTLLVKVALFALMIALGAINRLFLQPRLAAGSNSASESMRLKSLGRLQLNVWMEVLLGIAVMGAVGVLGRLPPATESCCAACSE